MTSEKIFLVKAKAETKYGTKIEDALFELDAEGEWEEITPEIEEEWKRFKIAFQISDECFEKWCPKIAEVFKELKKSEQRANQK